MPKTIPNTPSAPPALGPYSFAAEAAGLVFLSGQVGLDPATGASVGDDVAAQARQAMENIGGILRDVDLGYDDIVKTTIFLADMEDYPVVNAAYGEFFSDGFPARSAVQAAGLPFGYRVEIEVVAAR